MKSLFSRLGTQKDTFFGRLKVPIRATSLLVLALVIVFLTINGLAAGALGVRDYLRASDTALVPDNPWKIKAKVYPGWSPEDIYDIYQETWSRVDYRYSPLSQFVELPFSGRFVNVTEAGYRKGKYEYPWPPSKDDFSIFFFGASDMFAMGLPDWETIPAHIEEILEANNNNIAIYNFGQAAYYSSHQSLLFQRFLMEGIRPDMVVFMGGTTEFQHQGDDLLWTGRLEKMVENTNTVRTDPWHTAYRSTAISRLTNYIYAKVQQMRTSNEEKAQENLQLIKKGADKALIKKIISRYQENKSVIEALSDVYGIKKLILMAAEPQL